MVRYTLKWLNSMCIVFVELSICCCHHCGYFDASVHLHRVFACLSSSWSYFACFSTSLPCSLSGLLQAVEISCLKKISTAQFRCVNNVLVFQHVIDTVGHGWNLLVAIFQDKNIHYFQKDFFCRFNLESIRHKKIC